MGTQDLFIRGGAEAELCPGAEGLSGAGGRSCAVSLLNVSDGICHAKTASSLLPFLSLSPEPKEGTGSSRCASRDKRASLGFCTGITEWWDHITDFTLIWTVVSVIRMCVLTCDTPVTVCVTEICCTAEASF